MGMIHLPAVMNKVADVNLWWFSSWQISRCELIAVSHSVRLPTRHDDHMQQQSMENCVQMCRPTTHTHTHSPWIGLLFIGLQTGAMVWLWRWHHSTPAALPHGTVLMGWCGYDPSDLMTLNRGKSQLNYTESHWDSDQQRNRAYKWRNRDNPNGKRHSWVYEGAQLGLNIINDANADNVPAAPLGFILLQWKVMIQ